MVAAYVYNGGGRGNGDRPRARSINKFTDGGPATAGPAARKDSSALWSINCKPFTRVLPPSHNVNYFSIAHIYISRFINIHMNTDNARMTYIMKRREYIFTYLKITYFSNGLLDFCQSRPSLKKGVKHWEFSRWCILWIFPMLMHILTMIIYIMHGLRLQNMILLMFQHSHSCNR